MLDIYEDRGSIDVLTAANKLQEKGTIEQAGSVSYLTSLVNNTPNAANVAHYAKIVQKKATLRRLLSAASEITELGFDESQDIDLALDEAEKRLFNVSKKSFHQKS